MLAAVDLTDLPDDVAVLKTLVGELTSHYEARISTLQEQLNGLLAKRFGPSSEQISPDQLRLFNEAEHEAAAVAVKEDESETVSVPAHTRAKRGRKPLPEALPRVRVEHDLPEEQRPAPAVAV